MGFVIAAIILGWAGLAFSVLSERPEITNLPKIPIWRPRHPRVVIIAGIVGLFGFIVGFQEPNLFENRLWGFFFDLAPELVGLAFTVVVIDELNQRRLEQQEKERIIEQVTSPVRDVAVEALRLVRKHGWFEEEIKTVDLFYVQWQGADLQGTHLEEINLDGAHLQNANLRRANLEGAKLKGTHLEGADLRHANLDGAKLEGTYLRRANLEHASLREANLEYIHLEEANLSYADLWNANLMSAHMEGANLHETSLREANLRYTHLEGADLSYANLQDAKLSGAHLEGADLRHANLDGADLRVANLDGAKLEGTYLRRANLEHASLWGADLREAKLEGYSGLRRKSKWIVSLRHAEYDRETKWPNDFDPEKAGAVLKST